MNEIAMPEVFSSKKLSALAVSEHGRAGWQKGTGENEFIELIFFRPKWAGETYPGEWVPADIFRVRIAEKKKSNAQFYRLHPNLLEEKKQLKKLGRRKLYRDVSPCASTAWLSV